MVHTEQENSGLHDTAGQRKLPVVETSVPRRIEKISFGIMDSVEIMNSAEFQVFERALYKVGFGGFGRTLVVSCFTGNVCICLCRCLNVVLSLMVFWIPGLGFLVNGRRVRRVGRCWLIALGTLDI